MVYSHLMSFIIFTKLQYRKMKFYQAKAQVGAGVQLSCPFPRAEFLKETFRQLNSNQGSMDLGTFLVQL